MQLPKSTPESVGISSRNLLSFAEALQKLDSLHSFMLIRHGREVASAWWTPYNPDTPHLLFSLSKSFTSSAIGIARREGLLELDDKVPSFFPDKLPENMDERYNRMTIRHLLTMSSGHATCSSEYFTKEENADWIKDFFRSPLSYEPGERFVYNSGATYMLSAVIHKVTGQNLTEYLRPRLLDPLGIGERVWEQCPLGIDFGGWGYSLTTGEIARFGQLLLNNGWLNGKELIPADYLKLATSRQIDNSMNDQPDWKVGYGFQFWCCRNNAFRGDGAFGQYALVMPQQDAVLAVTSGLKNMQQVLDIVWEYLLPSFSSAPLPLDPEGNTMLQDYIGKLAMPQLHGPGRELPNTRYRMPDNPQKISKIEIASNEDLCKLTFHTPSGPETISAGFSERVENEITLNFCSPRPVSATAAWLGDKELLIRANWYSTPFEAEYKLVFDGDKVTLSRRRNLLFREAEWEPLTGTRQR